MNTPQDFLSSLSDEQVAALAGFKISELKKLAALCESAVFEKKKVRWNEQKANSPLLADLGLTTRTLNVLHDQAGITTLHELASMEIGELFKFRNFGKVSLMELEGLLEKHGLRFGSNSLYQ